MCGTLANLASQNKHILCIFSELKTGLNLKWQQYKAMLVKRFLNSRREKKLVLTQLILPLLMVLLGLLLIKTLQEPSKSEPPRVLNLSNLSIKGVPNTGFYADFRSNVDRKLFEVSRGTLYYVGLMENAFILSVTRRFFGLGKLFFVLVNRQAASAKKGKKRLFRDLGRYNLKAACAKGTLPVYVGYVLYLCMFT